MSIEDTTATGKMPILRSPAIHIASRGSASQFGGWNSEASAGGFTKKRRVAQKLRSDLGVARLWPEALLSQSSGEIGCSDPPVRVG
jgi:hypothetical protein